MTDFAFLRTDHSLHEGSNHVKDYVGVAAANNIKSLVLADRCSLASAIDFYKTCKEYSINPIMGVLLRVYDPEKVYNAQSARNGDFFKILYVYLSKLKNEQIGKHYVASNFEVIENKIITPLKKESTAKAPSIANAIKKASIFNLGIAQTLKFDCENSIAKQVEQSGAVGAEQKKKLCNEVRKGLFGDINLDENLCLNYINGFIVASMLLKNNYVIDNDCYLAEMKEMSNSNSFWTTITKQIINNYQEWMLGIKGKKKALPKLQEVSFVEYLSDIVKSETKLSKVVIKSAASSGQELLFKNISKKYSSNVDLLDGIKVSNLISINDVGDKSKGKETDSFLSLISNELKKEFSLSCNEVQWQRTIHDMIESNEILRKASEHINLTKLISEVALTFFVEQSRGSFNPYPIENLNELTTTDVYRGVILNALYPHILNAASIYKEKNEKCFSDITVFANTQEGYLNVKKLVSLSYMEGQENDLVSFKTGNKRCVNSFPKLPINRLKEFSTGLVAVVGLDNDELEKAIRYGKGEELALSYYESIFEKKNVIIGIQKSATEKDSEYLRSLEGLKNQKLTEIASKHGFVAFAMNNAFFLDKTDYEIMDTKAAMLLDEYFTSPSRIKEFLHGNYLKTPSEMNEAFNECPILLNNTSKLAHYLNIGDHLNIQLNVPILPEFPIPDGYTDTSYMRHLAETGLWEKFNFNTLREYGLDSYNSATEEQMLEIKELKEVFQKRLDYEIEIIDKMGFSGYFLIVSDFIVWGKSNGVPIGHGRGSGAGSVVAYGLNITDIDPIKYGLLFERFLNPERVSMPDFDVDFGSGFHPVTNKPMNRDSVIGYVQQKYNNPDSIFPSVAQIATHGLIAAKSGVKKLAKTRFLHPAFSDQLTKLFPDTPEAKIADCLEIPEVIVRNEREREVAELMSLTSRLEGLKQNSGVHAGGVVIARTDITDYTPFQIDTRDKTKIITQFDKNNVEYAGLVKFDFLGLANLTTIELARKYIRDYLNEDLDIAKIDFADKATFDLLKTGNTHGVFQLESDGMRKLVRSLRGDSMEDMSALLALYRPGPIQSGMIDNFIARKHGEEEISYPDAQYQHPCLESILKPTYGVILYQEQVMQCAQAMAGYTLGGADMLRRAMGKKKPEEMAKQRDIFKEGSINNGIDADLSMKIFDLIEKFAGYGFNKSHSMAYAHVTFQTAYLKTHYLREYMCALLTDQSLSPDKLKNTLVDCKRNGITILPPDINKSSTEFLPEGENTIRYGLLAIRGVGEDKLNEILNERKKNGDFISVRDLRKRGGKFFDKKVAEGLLYAGALDSLKTELKIKEGKLRKELDVVVSLVISPLINELMRDVHQKQHELDSLIQEGKVLREMISSLMFYYSERYGLKIPKALTNNKKLQEAASFLIKEIPLLVSNGASKNGIDEDVKNLSKQLELRNDLIKKYQNKLQVLNAAKIELKKAKGDASCSYKDSEDEQGEKLAIFDKRSFLLKDIELYVSIIKKMTDIDDETKMTKHLSGFNYDEITHLSDGFRLKKEMEFLTYYVSGHPFDINHMRTKLTESFRHTSISQLTYPVLDNLDEDDRKEVMKNTAPSKVAGVIANIREFKVKKENSRNFGKTMAIITIDDGYAEMSAMLLPDMREALKSDLYIGSPVAFEGVVTKDTYSAEEDMLTMMPSKIYSPTNIDNILYESKKFKGKKSK